MEFREALTALSILVAVATAVIGYRDRRSSERRRRTFEFLKSIVEQENLIHKTNVKFAIWIRNGRKFADDDVSADDDRELIRMLDFYDLIAYAAMKGVIEEEIIVTHLGGRMRSTYSMVEGYISDRRKKLERPGLYQYFERFIKEDVLDRSV